MVHLKEYEDFDDLEDLLQTMKNMNLSLTKEEERMLKFIQKFGPNKSPEDFADDIFDSYEKPEEFDIDRDSDYYECISDYFGEIDHCTRFDLRGNMRKSNFGRWDSECIKKKECYQTYKKMSSYGNS